MWITTTIMATTYALRGFDIPYLLTNGGPGQSSELLTTYMYKTAFTNTDYGYASAIVGVHRRGVPGRRRSDHPPPTPKGGRMTTLAARPDLAATPPMPDRRSRPPVRQSVHRTLLRGDRSTLIVVVQVYPLAWLFITSVRTPQDFAGGDPFALPTDVTLDNYARAFDVGNLGLNILNSLIVTLGRERPDRAARDDGRLRPAGARLPVQRSRARRCS